MVPEVSKSSTLVPLNRHQVFTGAANHGDNCYSVGCLNTTAFVVYGSGTNLVILDCGLETLQIIPGSKYGIIQVECVECSSSEGMVSFMKQNYNIFLSRNGRVCCIWFPTFLGFFSRRILVENVPDSYSG